MNFDLTEEQRKWKEIIHDFVSKEVKPSARMVDEKGKILAHGTSTLMILYDMGLFDNRSFPEKFLA